MILNSSGTAGCDQILKQMMYRGKKLKRKESLGEGERGKEKEKKNTKVQGHYINYLILFQRRSTCLSIKIHFYCYMPHSVQIFH